MPDIDYKSFTVSKIDAFINQIQLLKETDFPYEDSYHALNRIHWYFKNLKNLVENSVLAGDNSKSICSRATSKIFYYHRFLGYIAKSSDPKNSFETYSSFRRLAAQILGEDIQLIISSEWEDYSPVNLSPPKELIDFVFIGLPVVEAENSLIVPLNGHELGHSIWDTLDLKDKYRQEIQNSINESFEDRGEKGYIVEVSLIKCTEYFCDTVGIGLFGESYLYAFSYLIAPKISKDLNTSHPNAKNRGLVMTKAANDFSYQVPTNFTELFKTHLTPDKSRSRYCLMESERISLILSDTIIKDVKSLLRDKRVFYKKSSNFVNYKNELLAMIPISSAQTLADVTNAAWEVYFDNDKWPQLKHLPQEEQFNFLNELTIKSFEILEINHRISSL